MKFIKYRDKNHVHVNPKDPLETPKREISNILREETKTIRNNDTKIDYNYSPL